MGNEKILQVAKEAALQAGNYLKKNHGTIQSPDVEFKGEINLVTKYDKESQRIICELIKENFPNHSILAEEDLDLKREKDHLWIIDPLDGTTNFAYSLPIYCVSIAYLWRGISQVGVVYAPMLAEMFTVIKGQGLYLNQKKVRVSTEKKLDHAVLSTGFPYDIRESLGNNLNNFNSILLKSLAVRRMGSAAIDLAYTAAGRFDGFWESRLFPWDTAAGFLMVEEAGGRVTDYKGNPFNPFMKEIVASNGQIHDQMLEVLK